jgi:hypothetical protein
MVWSSGRTPDAPSKRPAHLSCGRPLPLCGPEAPEDATGIQLGKRTCFSKRKTCISYGLKSVFVPYTFRYKPLSAAVLLLRCNASARCRIARRVARPEPACTAWRGMTCILGRDFPPKPGLDCELRPLACLHQHRREHHPRNLNRRRSAAVAQSGSQNSIL